MRFRNTTLALFAAATLVTMGLTQAADITGAGATFPYPVYAKWGSAYQQQTGIKVNYQSIGSGGGIKQIKARTIDFGASDMPLKPEELREAGLIQFPMLIGGVVPVYNLPGFAAGQIKLTPTVLADIFLGNIKKWDNPAIAALNPGRKLPDLGITVVKRSDGSGTTFIFTNYLSKVSPEWKNNVGEGSSVKWPSGVGGKGNEGVASYVQRIKGGIGYIEFAYALQNKMSYILLKNRDGQFVEPSEASFKSAAANGNWDPNKGFYELLTDEPGKDSWPITGATFILMQKFQQDADGVRDTLKFFKWAYDNGDKMALELDYIPMPDNVSKLVQTYWKQNLSDSNANPIWK